MGIRLLVLLQPFVVDAFILAVLAEAAPVAMLVIVLHHLLKIFLDKRSKVYEALYGQAFREARHLWISLRFNLFYIAHGANASLIRLPKSLRPWFQALT